MRRSGKDYIIALLALTTLAGGYLAYNQAREIAELRRAPSTPPGPAEDHKRPRFGLSDSLTAEPVPADALAAGRSARSGALATGGQPTPPINLGEGAFLRMMENPEYQQLMAIQRKGMLDHRYAALFKRLGLSPQALETLKNLLVEKQNTVIDVAMAARAQGVNPRTDPAAMRQLMADAQSDIDASIRATLGEEAYATYQNYEQTLPYRNVVSQLETRLSYSASPLTEAQNEQLVQIVADTNQAQPGMAGAGPARPLVNFAAMPSPLNEEAMNRARGILTPDQYSALEQVRQQQQASLQMLNLMQEQSQGRLQPAVQLPPGG